MERDKAIDGFRAVAVLGVLFAHAVAYRFGGEVGAQWRVIRRLAEPAAQTSVLIFFVISGYIITDLLLKEEARHGRISILAFYIRRICRIIPPLTIMVSTCIALSLAGYIDLSGASMLAAATFTCNTGLTECDWWVAHTWSLAVEEQFYLLWPIMLVSIPGGWRIPIVSAVITVLLITFVVLPFKWHSNLISFACILGGVVCACSVRSISLIERCARYSVWLSVATFLAIGPLFLSLKVSQAFMPILIAYFIFAARALKHARVILAWRPLQILATASYSLYLWQQVFLAKPTLYRGEPPSLLFLPAVVVVSVLMVERPLIRLGRKLSERSRRAALNRSPHEVT